MSSARTTLPLSTPPIRSSRRDQPWEVWPHFNTTVTALREEDGRFRCWYMDFTNLGFEGGAEAVWKPKLSYAESSDGVHWRKPALGAVTVDGRNTNRLAWDDRQGTPVALSVIRDPSDPDPQRRYKMAYLPEKLNINVPKRSTITHSHSLGLCIAYSGDGITWTQEPSNPVSLIWGGDVLSLSYDEERARYVIYGRGHYAAETGNPAGGPVVYAILPWTTVWLDSETGDLSPGERESAGVVAGAAGFGAWQSS